jgi:hypothetical protein
MSMEDKILDDDDIIDLTDLLEEGESGKKGAQKKDRTGASPAQMNEPDSFDLGKEISMEYDVSVEEIDQGGDSADLGGGLSTKEEKALAADRKVKEEAMLDEKEMKELDISAESLLDETPAPPAPNAGPGPKDDLLVRGPVPEAKAEQDLLTDSLPPLSEEAKTLDFQDFAAAAPAPRKADLSGNALDLIDDVPEPPKAAPADDVIELTEAVAEPEPVPAAKPEGGMEIEFDRRALAEEQDAKKPAAAEVTEELRQQAPALIEAIVKPLMEQLVKDMIAATREQLPGIVEKVIREEIEKLKKLDS